MAASLITGNNMVDNMGWLTQGEKVVLVEEGEHFYNEIMCSNNWCLQVSAK